MRHSTIRGKILYTSRKPGREGQERGREHFTFTKHGDGSRVLRAQCEIDEPEPTVLRDIIFGIDPDGMPTDCCVRLTIGDTFIGAGIFRFTDGLIECESFGPSIGRISQRFPIVGPYDGFGTHPIVADAFNSRRMDKSKGPHSRPLRHFIPSPDHRGATPPLIAESALHMAYIGDETVTVAAGTFAASHFRFTDPDGDMDTGKGAHPDYDLWVTADDDALFLKGGVGGYMQTWYELVELNRS